MTHLRKWPQFSDGHSSDLVALSNFLIQCEEAMKSVNFLSDPLGFAAAPLLLNGKKILQELCRGQVDWDDEVPEHLKARWMKWRCELPALKELLVPRCIARVELHQFSNASTQGYGQCSYLRLKNDKGQFHCSFVMEKARVAHSNQ